MLVVDELDRADHDEVAAEVGSLVAKRVPHRLLASCAVPEATLLDLSDEPTARRWLAAGQDRDGLASRRDRRTAAREDEHCGEADAPRRKVRLNASVGHFGDGVREEQDRQYGSWSARRAELERRGERNLGQAV